MYYITKYYIIFTSILIVVYTYFTYCTTIMIYCYKRMLIVSKNSLL